MDLQDRNRAIARQLKDPSQPVDKIAADFGLSPEMIRKIGREMGVPARDRRALKPKRLIEREPISEIHVAIGIRVARHRAANKMTVGELAKEAKLSVPRLRAVETGCDAKMTLVELQRLAEVTQTDLGELLAS